MSDYSTGMRSDTMRNDMMKNGNRSLFVAALVGAAVGAGVALLYAPCAGVETRRWLANRGSALKQKTNSALEQGRTAVRRVADQIGNLADSVSTHTPSASAGSSRSTRE